MNSNGNQLIGKMSQCICSICSNRGPDIVYPILPQQLFAKYLQQYGIPNKIGFITKSYREYVHFRCAFFIPKLRWVKEIFQKTHVDYVCFGLEWILTQKNKEAMCAVCQKSTRAKVLLSCAGGEHEPCNKRYHIDCVIAVRKRIYYKPGKVTLLCNEHFAIGKNDPQNRVLDWIEFEGLVKQHIENSVISRDQDQQNYINEAQNYPRLPDLPEEIDQRVSNSLSNDQLSSWQPQQVKSSTQKKSSSKDTDQKEKDDILNQYLFRPRALFDIDYSAKNPLLQAQPTRKRNQHSNNNNNNNSNNNNSNNNNSGNNNNGNGNQSQPRDSSSVESSYAQDRNRGSVGAPIDKTSYMTSNEPQSSKNLQSEPLNSDFPSNKQLEEKKHHSKPQADQLEDNDDDFDVFSKYETKKQGNYRNALNKQMTSNQTKENLTKPQIQHLERLKQTQQQDPSANKGTQPNEKERKNQQTESQTQIQQLQQDLEEVQNEPEAQQIFLEARSKVQAESQSILTPKIRYRRRKNEESNKGDNNQDIEVLSEQIPIYPVKVATENQWEAMIYWWKKIDELFFSNSELASDLREATEGVEITLQPTIELLQRDFLSVLFQNSSQKQHLQAFASLFRLSMVHYELDPSSGTLDSNTCDLSGVTIFDRGLNQVDKSLPCTELLGCTLKYVEALEMGESELKDSIKMHQAIVSTDQQTELDVFYNQMLKEFEELNDRNSTNLKQLQLKLTQFSSRNADLLNSIQEGVSITDQLRWIEVIKLLHNILQILRCFEQGFKNKDFSNFESVQVADVSDETTYPENISSEKLRVAADCQVCFSGVSMQTNPMISCDTCSGYFHQNCYGIEEEELLNSFTFKCDRCKVSETKSLCCYICRKKQSKLPLKTARGQWFHPSCIVLYDYISASRPISLKDSVTLDQIDREIDISKECALCLKKKGRMTQCRECEKHYHLLCAYLSGFEVSVQQKDRKVHVTVACGVHTISLQKLVEQIFLRRHSLNLDGAASFDSTEGFYEQKLKESAQFKQIKKIFECELIELMPRKKIKPNA